MKTNLSLCRNIRRNGIRFMEQLLFPSRCAKCGVYREAEGTGCLLEDQFCPACAKEGAARVAPPFCTRCGKLFNNTGTGTHLCGQCIRRPPFVGTARGCLVYQGVVKDAVHLFKYNARLSLARAFAPVLQDGFQRYFAGTGIDLVMPVPLHKKKTARRGFNQSFVLGRELIKKTAGKNGNTGSLKLDYRSLQRIRMTAPQTGLDVKERNRNLAGAFAVTRPRRVDGAHILLLDDVYTTGATCNAAAEKLLAAGAKKVDALVLARA